MMAAWLLRREIISRPEDEESRSFFVMGAGWTRSGGTHVGPMKKYLLKD